MNRIQILGLAGLLLYNCQNERKPIPMPNEQEVKENARFGLFGFDKEPIQFYDINDDGIKDGFYYHFNRRDYFMAYDSSQIELYKNVATYGDPLTLTPELDSAMQNFILAAKEFRWQYELEKYKQQKQP